MYLVLQFFQVLQGREINYFVRSLTALDGRAKVGLNFVMSSDPTAAGRVSQIGRALSCCVTQAGLIADACRETQCALGAAFLSPSKHLPIKLGFHLA